MSDAVVQEAGAAFGAASTLVAQLGILLGMTVSGQPQSALVVASAASAVSGSFGDAFSMFVSESTAQRSETALSSGLAVLFSKLALGAVFVVVYLLVPNRSVVVPAAAVLSMVLLYYLSTLMVRGKPDAEKEVLPTFGYYVALTGAVVATTSGFGYLVRRFFVRV